ncbi:hypothetical protein Nans01_24970 [Nocardiopsis ansamitocini]|uniref:Sirohydrochlorin ferrochelatase n=2 Tax=Nocardiopsis ansamitocini TaxID=1670832 RepID=A0A9W6P6Q2_9ACTN|nr:hypothetical protein Nans01_24970 [Nocardiopsis ansamitocini]
MADLVRSYRPEVPIRFAHTEGEAGGITEVLAGLVPEGAPNEEERPPGYCDAVIVPLVTGTHTAITATIAQALPASGAVARITDGLGPHPMLAEALHLRLAEGGFARADRMRLISVVAASDTTADGVMVGSVGGPEAIDEAGVSAVLLAARLGVTVLPAALDDPAHVAQIFDQLAAAGSRRPVIAPSVIGAEFPQERIAELAAEHGASYSASLGASSTLAKIVALRYAEALNALGIDQQPALEELPAPVGSRHRPEH